MRIYRLTLPCVALFMTLAVLPLVSQEQSGTNGGDQAVSPVSAQPGDSGAASKETAAPAQPAERDSGAAEPVKSSSAPAAVKPAAAKTGTTPERAVKKDIPVKEAPNPQAGAGLLDVSDEEYKDSRIPGMPAVKKPDDSMKAVDEEAEDSVPADSGNKTDHEGLFGMSKETGDTVTRVVLVLLIFVIFILYRIRSKSGGRRVTRSYFKR